MRHGSLFSGIGGFDLAAEWMGWENVFHCEWMEFPRKVLDYHFPNADSHIDICKTDFKKYANTIDVLTGGFPCQPFSLAGKRKGTDDERYLWGEMLRAIQEIKPKFVIAENVAGITSIDGGMVFQQVCLDLEAEGYEVQPFIIPACAKNAPHRRDRCWFIAYTTSNGFNRWRNWSNGIWQETGEMQTEICTSQRITTNSQFKSERSNGRANDETQKNLRRQNEGDVLGTLCGDGYATDTTSTGSQARTKSKSKQHRQNDKARRIFGWQGFPTESPVCGGDDGLPTKLDGITFPKWRAESIKGYGNAIVPQIAHQLFQILETL